MLKIRRPLGRLIFNMGIAIPGKTVFVIETAPLALGVNRFSAADVLAPGVARSSAAFILVTYGTRIFVLHEDRTSAPFQSLDMIEN